MNGWVRGVFGVLSCLALVHCEQADSTCNSFGSVPPIIRVTNADTGAPLCDALVVLTGPSSYGLTTPLSYSVSSQLEQAADPSSCIFLVSGGPGSYELTVSRDGFESQVVSGVMVGVQSCNQRSVTPPEHVQVALHPN